MDIYILICFVDVNQRAISVLNFLCMKMLLKVHCEQYLEIKWTVLPPKMTFYVKYYKLPDIRVLKQDILFYLQACSFLQHKTKKILSFLIAMHIISKGLMSQPFYWLFGEKLKKTLFEKK